MTMIPQVKPPVDLENNIFQNLRQLEKRQIRLRFYREVTTSTISFASLVPLGLYFYADLQNSGFNEYASLAISDSVFFFNQWADMAYFLTDSLPVSDLVVCLSAFTVFIWSTSGLVRGFRIKQFN